MYPATSASAQEFAVTEVRALPWPRPLNNPDAFDTASRAALIVYASALDRAAQRQATELRSAAAVNSVDSAFLGAWLDSERARILSNYKQASNRCSAADWTCLPSVRTFSALVRAGRAEQSVPADFVQWRNEAVKFTDDFAREQLQLAALFPSASNEAAVFNTNERTGDSFPDRTFAITFDDGPTAPGGTTDQTVGVVDHLHLSATFFLLGVRLESRLATSGTAATAALYGRHCVASHGWEHQSHETWDAWQESVKRMDATLRDTFPPESLLPLFRPPGGHRRADSVEFFASQSLRIMLWNINTYDWDRTMNPDTVTRRVLMLMLIRRHGILLFHDIFANALTAVPAIVRQLNGAITWSDCHQLERL